MEGDHPACTEQKRRKVGETAGCARSAGGGFSLDGLGAASPEQKRKMPAERQPSPREGSTPNGQDPAGLGSREPGPQIRTRAEGILRQLSRYWLHTPQDP